MQANPIKATSTDTSIHEDLKRTCHWFGITRKYDASYESVIKSINLTTHGCMCSLFCAVISIVAQLVLKAQITLAAETRRIQQRRAAHRRAQRKARGTLLTALRPVSQRGFFRGLSFVCDTNSVSDLNYLPFFQRENIAVDSECYKLSKTVKDPQKSKYQNQLFPRLPAWRPVSFCQGIESILNFQAAKAAKARPVAIG